MHEADQVGLLATLPDRHCDLNHGPDTEKEHYPAIDILVVDFGQTVTDVIVHVNDSLSVAVCVACHDALLGDEWVLLYCVYCGENQWIARERARLNYRKDDHYLWLKGCPKCQPGIKGGVYFTPSNVEWAHFALKRT